MRCSRLGWQCGMLKVKHGNNRRMDIEGSYTSWMCVAVVKWHLGTVCSLAVPGLDWRSKSSGRRCTRCRLDIYQNHVVL